MYLVIGICIKNFIYQYYSCCNFNKRAPEDEPYIG
jgi:hypothetical protein